MLQKLVVVHARLLWRDPSAVSVDEHNVAPQATTSNHARELLSRGMRVAWVSPSLPLPENSGFRIRVRRLQQAFSLDDGDEVDLFCGLLDAREEREWAALQSTFSGAFSRAFAFRRRATSKAGQVLPFVVRTPPVGMGDAIAREHRRQPYDLLVVSFSWCLAWLAGRPDVPVLLEEHNTESAYHLQSLRTEGWSAARFRDWVWLRQLERHAWQQADGVSVVQPGDLDIVSSHARRTIVVPNGTDLDALQYIAPSRRRGHRLLFVGQMSYAPNVRAAQFLAQQVLPVVRQSCPDAQLYLVGRDAGPDVERLASAAVHVTGEVPTLAPYFDDAAVFVNGLDAGAGSSLKVPEALSTGLPMVSTTFGVRGFPVAHQRDVLIADDPVEFAAHVVDVLQHRTHYDAQAAAAYDVACGFGWGASQSAFRAFAEELVGAH